MALVLSGREQSTDRLNRQAELDAFLQTPEGTLECKKKNDAGWTALMLAARNSRTDSTEGTVAQLLAHESGSEVARMREEGGWTTLMVAACNSRADSTEETVAQLLAHESGSEVARMKENNGCTALMFAASNSGTTSTEGTVAQLLAHESGSDVARMQAEDGCTALMLAARKSGTDSTERTVAQLLAHESGSCVVSLLSHSGESTLENAVYNGACTPTMLHALCIHASTQEIQRLFKKYPGKFDAYFIHLYERVRERDTTSRALKEGIQVAGSIVLTYL